jgi:hypothetical protein
MNKKEIPQDYGHLSKLTKEVCYAVNDKGEYTTELSTGWEVKASALDAHWKDIEVRIREAKERVIRGEASPILYYMELNLMDPGVLCKYTGFWQWQLKRHVKPDVFARLSPRKLQRYADAFNISIETLQLPLKHDE